MILAGINSFLRKSFFLRILSIYRNQITILFILGLFSSSLLLIGPYLSKLFIDGVFIAKDISKFWRLSIFGGVLFIFSMLINLFVDITKNKMSIKLKLNLMNRFIRKLYSLDLSFFQSRSVGENVYRATDVERVVNFILEHYPSLFLDIARLIVILCVSFWISPQMTLSLVFASPLFLLHSLYLQKKLRPIYREIWRASALVYKNISEAFTRVIIIKALNLESYQRYVYLRTLLKNMRWRISSFRWFIINSLSQSFLSRAIYSGITLYGGWLIIKSRMTLGAYGAVMLYITQLGGLLQLLGDRFRYFTQELVSAERFFEIIDFNPQIKDAPKARNLVSAKGEIRFDNVYFGYQKDKLILKGIKFTIADSSWVGIAGPSGCGKTTSANLMLRLYEPLQGRILLDGLDLRDIKLRSLREKFAIATQRPLLFDVSIEKNIAYGLKGINRADIREAAKVACVDEFIEQLPEGYDTLVGDDACLLSEGLKQRIAIARAIVRNPQILILDEATASVDSVTEENIFKVLRQKRQGLTTIIVSHRLFSIKDADTVYFLGSDGNMEEGTHTGLMACSGSYRDFFQNQTEEKLYKY